MKAFINLTVALCFSLALTAQVGIGTTTPLAALHIESNNNGLLIPRVALTSTSTLPVGFLTPTNSELVYNTATAGDVTPGFYYLSGPTGLPWVRLETGADGTGWEIDGNNNIVDGTNFIGTVTGTNVDVAFRRAGLPSGKIGANNTSFGLEAGTTVTGNFNTAVGNNALTNVRAGQENTAVGHNALTGIRGGTARNNTAVGFQAMSSATGSTSQVVAIGANALNNNTANNTTAVGYNALAANTSQLGNTAVGASALAIASGNFNTALGQEAGSSASGASNTLIGYLTGRFTSGSTNIAIGSNIQLPNPGGSDQLNIGNWIYGNAGNIGIGQTTPNGALDITSTNNGLLIPRVALTLTTDVTVVTPTASELVYNTTIATPSNDVSPGFYYLDSDTGPWKRLGEGASTPPPPPPPPTATGGWLIDGNADIVEGTNFIGTTNDVDVVFRREDAEAGRIGTTLTTFGLGAGIANTGLDNTYIGHNAGNTISAGAARNNVAVGSQALEGGPGSSLAQTVAIGAQALQNPSNSTSNNIAIGYQAARDTNGSNNVIVGAQANTAVTPVGVFPAEAASLNPNETVVIGAQARAIGNNSVAIGYRAKAVANNEIRLGNSQTQTVITAGVVTAESYVATVGPVTGYADYVFEDYFDGISKINANYKFNTLESAEAFVIKNGHLPGVKSYAEVKANGFKLDITKATNTNLEKLEEQFLYITQLNKKIKTQDTIISTQDEKIKALEARLERIEKLLNN